jgi:polysaccharide deacetylase family protein (PEP-CTERM system associated)
MQSVLTVDVEDWFHILDVPSAPPLERWADMPSHVEKNFLRMLDLFSEHRATSTCFFIGWVAERFPHLVREAAARGHEIASHSYSHCLVYRMTRDEFYDDALRARKVLEDISGAPVVGYRSAGFSVTDQTQWFFEALADAGYEYDSSVFPAPREHGGMNVAERGPHLVAAGSKRILEFPITVADLLGRPLCFFGGGYLRLFPHWLIRWMSYQVLDEGRPVVFYIHPREIDPAHPRLPMSPRRRFKSYVNLHTTETKLRRILEEFPVTSFRDFRRNHPELAEGY